MESHRAPILRQKLTQGLRSAVVKRSVMIGGRKTSVSVEDAFWGGLRDIAHSRHMTLSSLCGYIDGHRPTGNLSSNIRLFVLEYVCAQREVAAREAAAQPVGPAGANPP